MSKKSWAFLIRVYLPDDEGTPFESFRFEVDGFSPFERSLADTAISEMESDDHIYVKNPAAISAFINQIGSPNVLSIRKKVDLSTKALKEFFNNKTTIYGFRLDVASLAHIPENLKGRSRLEKIQQKAFMSVRLLGVSIVKFYSYTNETPPSDVISIKCESVGFDYEGMNY